MAAWVITGDEALVSLELTTLVERLVGDGDRSLIVEELECGDGAGDPSSIIDALTTMSLFADRRVVVLRDLDGLLAEHHEPVAAAIANCIEGVDLVVTAGSKLPKVLESGLSPLKPEKVGAAVVSKPADRVRWVEEKLVEAGFTWAPEVPRLIEGWFGGDHARVAGLVRTLVSALGEGAKLTRSDVEDFLGDAGRIEPWRLTDPIDAGNTADALVMLHRMLSDSHPLQVLGLLANRYAQMMKVDGRGLRTEKEAAEVLGGHPFAAKKILEQQMRLGSANLARAVRLIAEADVDLRGGKDWDEMLVLEVLVARLSRLAGGGQSGRKKTRTAR